MLYSAEPELELELGLDAPLAQRHFSVSSPRSLSNGNFALAFPLTLLSPVLCYGVDFEENGFGLLEKEMQAVTT